MRPLTWSSSCDSPSESGWSSSSTLTRAPGAFEPGGVRVAAAGEHDDRARGQRREQLAAQVAAECGHALPRVEQDQRPLGLVGGRERGGHGVGDRRHVAALDEDRSPAAFLGAPGDRAQERALPDTAGAMEEDY